MNAWPCGVWTPFHELNLDEQICPFRAVHPEQCQCVEHTYTYNNNNDILSLSMVEPYIPCRDVCIGLISFLRPKILLNKICETVFLPGQDGTLNT